MLETGKKENRETEFDYDAIGKNRFGSEKTILRANIYQILSGVRWKTAVLFQQPQTAWNGA